MNDLLKQRIARLLDNLGDERGYQILDYIEFLESKYAERGRPGGIFAEDHRDRRRHHACRQAPDPGDQRHHGAGGWRRQGDEGARCRWTGRGGRGGKAAETASKAPEAPKPETKAGP